MKAEEKAEALIKKMLSKSPNIQDGVSIIDAIQAKQCALIAVDEILKLEQARLIVGNHNYYDYYVEVKKELEKL